MPVEVVAQGMMMRNMIRKKVEDAIRSLYGNVEIPPFLVQQPEDHIHGDYAVNAALLLARVLKKNPMEIATNLKNQISKIKNDLIEKVEIAPPGFLNFWLSEKAYASAVQEILKKEKRYGAGLLQKSTISVEYLDANPTGPVHVGHARSGFWGDVLANIFEFSGARVSREFYVNNATSSTQIKSLGKTALGKGEEYRHETLLSLLKKPLVARKLGTIQDEGEAGFYIAGLIQKSNEAFLREKAKIRFDVFFEEQSVYDTGGIDRILSRLASADMVYEKDGAVWLRSSQYGDIEDRVLVRSTGEPTYLLPDIAYHDDRLARRGCARAINIFGADHHGYGPRLKAALQAIGIAPERIVILTAQLVRLTRKGKEVKMSKRKGEFVTLEELIDEVGLDAARFFFLEKTLDTHMDFDLDFAKERSVKNPVYYIQYAQVRCRSILKKATRDKRQAISATIQVLQTPEEQTLIKKLMQFPEVVEDITCDYHVHRLPRYALELARLFHYFYEKHRVITEDKNLFSARLALVEAARIILKNTLGLMGMSVPEKM